MKADVKGFLPVLTFVLLISQLSGAQLVSSNAGELASIDNDSYDSLKFQGNYTTEQIDDYFMDIAIKEAEKGKKKGGIPIGSVIVSKNYTVIGKGHNQLVQKRKPILHGEMDAINKAGPQNRTTYEQATLYTTLSPCSMCTGAILLFGIKRVVVCENKNHKSEDGEDLLRKRGVEVIVQNKTVCIDMMADFIENNKEIWFQDAGLVCTDGDCEDKESTPSSSSNEKTNLKASTSVSLLSLKQTPNVSVDSNNNSYLWYFLKLAIYLVFVLLAFFAIYHYIKKFYLSSKQREQSFASLKQPATFSDLVYTKLL